MRGPISLRLYVFLSLATALVIGVSACGDTMPTRDHSKVVTATPQSPPAPVQRVPPPAPVPPPVKPPEPVPPPPVAADVFRVALLLPLSGPLASIGEGMLNSAQLALFDTVGERFILQVYDTQGKPEAAAEVAAQAVREGAQLILGPVIKDAVKAVAPVAKVAHVNVVAFSTDPLVASDGVYIMGFLLRQQVQRVVTTARARGMMRFAALAPATDYGRAVVAALRDTVAVAGGSVTQVEYYDQGGGDLSAPVRRLAIQKDTFDAVLIPERGTKLKELANFFPYYNVDLKKVRLLGTQLWDEPGLGREQALVGGWYAVPSSPMQKQFVERYRQSFGGTPPPNSSLAYDAVALASALERTQGQGNAAALLTTEAGFVGIDGIFRLQRDGIVERGLAVMEVTPTGTSELSPAPRVFDQP